MTSFLHDIRIEELGASGDGMAQVDGARLYVPLTVPGDRVDVCDIRPGPGGTLQGEAAELLEAGEARREAPCPHHGGIGKAGCGGCALQQLRLEQYRAFKLDLVRQAVARAGLEVGEWVEAACTPEGARRRAVFAVRRMGQTVALGFNEAGSHAICNLETCRVLDARIMAVLPGLRAALAEVLDPGESADVQVAILGGGLDVVLVRERPFSAFDISAFAGPMEQMNILRLSWQKKARARVEPLLVRQVPEIRMGGFVVRPPAGGFLQASDAGEAALVGAVREGLAPCTSVADLFSGVGTFALPLVADGKKVLASDAESESMDALAEAGRRNVLGDKLKVVRRNLMQKAFLAAELAGMDGVVLDPPRAGAATQVEQVVAAKIARVMMVSCNPATFARDAGLLAQAGYRIAKLWPVDQFLYSPHMEIAALFVL